ncbi:MAG: A/G-specific adenine glycosylase [Acidobacteriota bacterium]
MRPSPRLEPPTDPAQWARRVIDWFDRNQRDLPWRRRPDPYRIWLSEVMLQQTQVQTVLPYYEKFLAAYPSVQELAAADEAEVLDLWAGLGYYSRARNLHRTARIVSRDRGGMFPDRLDELLRLPGIGRYSAGAILSIALGKPCAVLDGNVKRVLARLLALREAVPDSSLWRLLEETVILPEVADRISAFNQGLMELGAVVCTPQNPDCSVCPLTDWCRARQLGLESSLPRPRPRRKSVTEAYTVLVVKRGERLLMARNEDGPFLKGFWEFPRLAGRFEPTQTLAGSVQAQLGLSVGVETILGEVRHQITFRKLVFRAIGAVLLDEPQDDRWKWLIPGEKGCPASAYVRKVMAALPDGWTSRGRGV